MDLNKFCQIITTYTPLPCMNCGYIREDIIGEGKIIGYSLTKPKNKPKCGANCENFHIDKTIPGTWFLKSENRYIGFAYKRVPNMIHLINKYSSDLNEY
jgi:hypothetical protein